jgi:imidazolonepropionase-like amidohydrolase
MVEAGLTPYAALETATINPATFLNLKHQTGTIEVGKQSDLLLLEKNPLEDISNTRSITAVFKGLKYYDRSAINKILEAAKTLGK